MTDKQLQIVLRDKIKSLKMRFTQERVIILSKTVSIDGPFTGKDVFGICSKDEKNIISNASVYNSLRLFEQLGFIKRIYGGVFEVNKEYSIH